MDILLYEEKRKRIFEEETKEIDDHPFENGKMSPRKKHRIFESTDSNVM